MSKSVIKDDWDWEKSVRCIDLNSALLLSVFVQNGMDSTLEQHYLGTDGPVDA